jgi:hypothetical protein
MQQSNTIAELAKALSKAQGECSAATKEKANPFFKSKYATLEEIVAVLKNPLANNGLSIVQMTDFDDKGIWITTQINHSSGEWINGKYPVNPTDGKPQSLGSAITYAKRYALQAAMLVPSEDDDGNSAQQNHRQAPTPVAPKAVEQVDTLAELRAQVSKLVVKNKIPATEMRKFIATNFGEGSMLASLGENELQQTLAFVEKNHDK